MSDDDHLTTSINHTEI